MQTKPDRVFIYLVLALLCASIAAITGPSAALLTLLQIVVVVEIVNLVRAPGDMVVGKADH